jgi:hypothetical protein
MIGTNGIKIIPEILIQGGDGGSNGPISGLLGMELLKQIQEKSSKETPKTPIKGTPSKGTSTEEK